MASRNRWTWDAEHEPSHPLRRALELRDGGCTWEGCTAPVAWCDGHHIIHWADGGGTNLGNTALLCRKHHTRTHRNQSDTPQPEP